MSESESRAIHHGGTRSVSYFTGLLGFDTQREYAVDSVTFVNGRFQVVTRQGNARGPVLFVDKASPEGRAFVTNSRLALVYQGKNLPESAAALLQNKAFASQPEATMESLESVFFNDPDTWSEATEVQEPVGPDEVYEPALDPERNFALRLKSKLAGPEGYVADPDAFADFLARYEILCQKVISMWLFNPCTLILHGDSECFGPPNLGLNMVMTINAPWDNRVRDLGRARKTVARVAEPRAEDLLLYVTDIREKDVIAGSQPKERAVFERVFGSDPGLVVFFHACVGVVSGSDIESIFDEYKAKHNMPVLYFRGGENRNLQDFYTDVLVGVRKTTEHPADAPKNRINLVGYSGHATADLMEGLKHIGVDVNGVLLPQVTVDPVVNFEKASLNVFLPNLDFEIFYDQLRQESGVTRHIYPVPPYGIEGTRRWYRTLADECGLGDVDAAIDEHLGPSLDQWNRLTPKARNHRLAIVARDYEAEHLVDSQYTYGVPVLSMLEEMGFGVDVFLMATEADFTQWAMKRIGEAAPAGLNVEVKTFRTHEQMVELLEQSRSRAVFSNYYFDWRSTSCGKSVFSLQHFEAGFDGAVRTLKRLIGVCETEYFARYSRFLKRDRVGRRIH